MNPDPRIPDVDYEVEIIEEPAPVTPSDPETESIEQEGDPFGDNFA